MAGRYADVRRPVGGPVRVPHPHARDVLRLAPHLVRRRPAEAAPRSAWLGEGMPLPSLPSVGDRPDRPLGGPGCGSLDACGSYRRCHRRRPPAARARRQDGEGWRRGGISARTTGTRYPMEDGRRFHGLTHAIITAVMREGPDVVVRFRNAQLERYLRHLRFTATMCFVDARRINSVHCLNPDIDSRLEPGWRVTWLDFDGLRADLCVDYNDYDTSVAVAHRIWCDAVQLRMKLAPIDTLKAYYFPASFCSVSEKPVTSPPIDGQEGPMPH